MESEVVVYRLHEPISIIVDRLKDLRSAQNETEPLFFSDLTMRTAIADKHMYWR
jgi:hypothetical protein